MEFIPGKKITDISPLRLMEIDGPGLADELFRSYLKQILVDGVFHADPHPGNVFLTDDERIALLDLGMVARLIGKFPRQLVATAAGNQRRSRRRCRGNFDQDGRAQARV